MKQGRAISSLFLAFCLSAACGQPASSPDDAVSDVPTEERVPSGDTAIEDSADDYRPIKAQIAVLAWGEATHGEALIEPVPMFFGDVNGDGVEDVLAVIYAEVGASGHLVEPTIFISDAGEFVPYETLGPISGVNPRGVTLSYGQVELTTTVHIDGDASCCPSGEKSWLLDLDF